MNKRVVLLLLLIFGSLCIYVGFTYGYLIQSFRNFPQSTKITSIEPKILNKNSETSQSPKVNISSDPELSFIHLPPGFRISYFAKDVPGARSMTKGADETLFVGTRAEGVAYALPDANDDGRADARYILSSGLDNPNGVAYKDGTLYVAEIGRVIRFTKIDSEYKNKPVFEVVNKSLPDLDHHGWRYIAFGPDKLLYIGIGMPCNICDDEDQFGRIIRLNPDQKSDAFEVYARGIRNTVGFDWNPNDNSLWFTDNGRDWLGDDSPPDELNHAPAKDMHFGFPYCHGNSILDPDFGKGKNCNEYINPFQILGPHVASLGMKFYRGSLFPQEYIGKIIIAEHGSWNRKVPIGYRISIVDPSSPSYQIFADGWLRSSGDARGRPVDILELNDGSILISDDLAGSIYRVTYQNP